MSENIKAKVLKEYIEKRLQKLNYYINGEKEDLVQLNIWKYARIELVNIINEIERGDFE